MNIKINYQFGLLSIFFLRHTWLITVIYAVHLYKLLVQQFCPNAIKKPCVLLKDKIHSSLLHLFWVLYNLYAAVRDTAGSHRRGRNLIGDRLKCFGMFHQITFSDLRLTFMCKDHSCVSVTINHK